MHFHSVSQLNLRHRRPNHINFQAKPSAAFSEPAALKETTSVYTLVSIKKLKEVHELTHPEAHLGRRESQKPAVSEKDAEELLSSLAAESDDEEGDRV